MIMHRRIALLALAATVGCTGDTPDPEPFDSTLLAGDMSAEFDGVPFEPGFGVLFYDEAPGTLLLSTEPVTCPYVDPETVVGQHVIYTVSSIDPGEQTNPHSFWLVTESSTQDYPYDEGTLDVTDTTDETFAGALTLGAVDASLEGTFEARRCHE